MKFTGKLKEQVEKAETKEEKKRLFKDARMKLTDEELEMVSGGGSGSPQPCFLYHPDFVGDDVTGCGFGADFDSVEQAVEVMNKHGWDCPNCGYRLAIQIY